MLFGVSVFLQANRYSFYYGLIEGALKQSMCPCDTFSLKSEAKDCFRYQLISRALLFLAFVADNAFTSEKCRGLKVEDAIKILKCSAISTAGWLASSAIINKIINRKGSNNFCVNKIDKLIEEKSEKDDMQTCESLVVIRK